MQMCVVGSIAHGRAIQHRQTTAFQPIRHHNAQIRRHRHSVSVHATAAPATAAQSPFSAVDSEEKLFGILKAGAASGKVRLRQCMHSIQPTLPPVSSNS